MRGVEIAIEAERSMPLGSAAVARYSVGEPASHQIPGEPVYRLDMALTSRPPAASGRYGRPGAGDRFESLGRIWMAPPDEPMRFYSDAGSARCVQCLLLPAAVAQWIGEDRKPDASLGKQAFDLPGRRLPTLLTLLADELRFPGFATGPAAELIIGQIAIEVGRFWMNAVAAEEPAGLAPWRIRAIEERLAVVDATPSLDELARLCGLSVRQLTRGYRASTGVSIGAAIAAERIEKAKLLLTQDLGIKVVAHRLGFASTAGFGYAFRRAVGETPGAYRRRVARRLLPVAARSR